MRKPRLHQHDDPTPLIKALIFVTSLYLIYLEWQKGALATTSLNGYQCMIDEVPPSTMCVLAEQLSYVTMFPHASQRQHQLEPTETVHHQVIETLPGNAICASKEVGITHGKVCDVSGVTYFLKFFTPHRSKSGSTSYEEFNRQFAQHNICIKVPRSLFFKEQSMANDFRVYLGTQGVDELQFSGNIAQLTDKELGANGVAKLAVATTFFRDLHHKNIGYDQQGLVLIDVDSKNIIPTSILDYLELAKYGIKSYSPTLSLDDVAKMISIYEAMRHIPLPAFHEEFHLTNETYQELLRIYIDACHKVLDHVTNNHPDLQADSPNHKINYAFRFNELPPRLTLGII